MTGMTRTNNTGSPYRSAIQRLSSLRSNLNARKTAVRRRPYTGHRQFAQSLSHRQGNRTRRYLGGGGMFGRMRFGRYGAPRL